MTTFRIFRSVMLAACAAAMLSLTFISCDKDDEVSTNYLPAYGDKAIVFIHRFNPDDYTVGKQIVIDNFSDAIDGSGQTRRTYFMSQPDSAEVYVVSFFHPNSSTSVWLNSDERDAVLAMLQPLYREPLTVHEYATHFIHDTHTNTDQSPGYLPEPGDEVLVFDHFFRADSYEAAKTIITVDLPQVLETTDQKRRSYVLLDPTQYEVLGITFFHPDSDEEEWLLNADRQILIDSLSQMTGAPSIVDKYTLERALDSN